MTRFHAALAEFLGFTEDEVRAQFHGKGDGLMDRQSEEKMEKLKDRLPSPDFLS